MCGKGGGVKSLRAALGALDFLSREFCKKKKIQQLNFFQAAVFWKFPRLATHLTS